MRDLYLTAGFSVFSIDYRLAPETPLSSILEDVQDALNWLIKEGPKQFSIDAERIAVIGSSAGAFLALSTGLFPNKPKAIVSFYGYGDLTAEWVSKPSSYYLQRDHISKTSVNKSFFQGIPTEGTIKERFLFYLYTRQSGTWLHEVIGPTARSSHALLNSLSPIATHSNHFPATLLLHGTDDEDVPYAQSVFMRASLLKNKVSAKLITIPNGQHVFEDDFEDSNVQEALKKVIQFLKNQFKS